MASAGSGTAGGKPGGKPKKKPARPRQKSKVMPAANPALPPDAAITGESTLISPKGTRFRVIHSTEKDPYDPPKQ